MEEGGYPPCSLSPLSLSLSLLLSRCLPLRTVNVSRMEEGEGGDEGGGWNEKLTQLIEGGSPRAPVAEPRVRGLRVARTATFDTGGRRWRVS